MRLTVLQKRPGIRGRSDGVVVPRYAVFFAYENGPVRDRPTH